MRIQVQVTTRSQEIPWKEVLRPGRGVVYDLLAETAPDVGERMHSQGLGRFGLAPFGYSAPRFPEAPRRRGHYPTDGPGAIEFSSPVPEVAEALAAGLSRTRVLDWGGVALQLHVVETIAPPDFSEAVPELILVVRGGAHDPSARSVASQEPERTRSRTTHRRGRTS